MLTPVLITLLLLADPNTITGKVVSVRDGDTIDVLEGETVIRVRFEGIDAPEYSQDFGTKAKQALSEKILGKNVTVLWSEKDRYDRILGHVMLDGKWINKWLVQGGWAWHYKQYSSDARLAKWEEEARAAKQGLWAGSQPKPPWDFRHEATEAAKQAAPKKKAA